MTSRSLVTQHGNLLHSYRFWTLEITHLFSCDTDTMRQVRGNECHTSFVDCRARDGLGDIKSGTAIHGTCDSHHQEGCTGKPRGCESADSTSPDLNGIVGKLVPPLTANSLFTNDNSTHTLPVVRRDPDQECLVPSVFAHDGNADYEHRVPNRYVNSKEGTPQHLHRAMSLGDGLLSASFVKDLHVTDYLNGHLHDLNRPWLGDDLWEDPNSLRYYSRKSSDLQPRTPQMVIFILAAIIFSVPLVAASLQMELVLRISAGVGSCGTAVAVIPLRTRPDVASTWWIIIYGVWAVTFSTYLTLNLWRFPSQMRVRRRKYLFHVITFTLGSIAVLTFSMAQKSTSTTPPTLVHDGPTIYGPLFATIWTYATSLWVSPDGYDAEVSTYTSSPVALESLSPV
ncbi:hypothetical protein SUNI508_13351 [Seiridium unicorne]|uniref:Uncharacterized protein n=1 Tax=Seiridium unicorne TaxID=138068 RepID=A0ABR2VD96_9PEZI